MSGNLSGTKEKVVCLLYFISCQNNVKSVTWGIGENNYLGILKIQGNSGKIEDILFP